MKEIIKEFGRTAIVGVISFIADSAVLVLLKEIIFSGDGKVELFISTAAGFIVGLIVSYLLSISFVFKNSHDTAKKGVKSFAVFTIISISGLAVTEIFMHVGVNILKFHYAPIKLIAATFVLFWNYCGRKVFIFRR